VPYVVKFSQFYKNILFVGNVDGSVNILSIKNVKCMQSLQTCHSQVKSILEMDESTIVVVGVSGDISLVFNEAEYD